MSLIQELCPAHTEHSHITPGERLLQCQTSVWYVGLGEITDTDKRMDYICYSLLVYNV